MDRPHSSFGESFAGFIARGELRYARCPACAGVLSFAERVCSRHPRGALEWLPASGRATLHSYARYRIGYAQSHPPPYIVAVIELEEGPRLVSTVIGTRDHDPAIGCALTAAFEPSGRLIFATQSDNAGEAACPPGSTAVLDQEIDNE